MVLEPHLTRPQDDTLSTKANEISESEPIVLEKEENSNDPDGILDNDKVANKPILIEDAEQVDSSTTHGIEDLIATKLALLDHSKGNSKIEEETKYLSSNKYPKIDEFADNLNSHSTVNVIAKERQENEDAHTTVMTHLITESNSEEEKEVDKSKLPTTTSPLLESHQDANNVQQLAEYSTTTATYYMAPNAGQKIIDKQTEQDKPTIQSKRTRMKQNPEEVGVDSAPSELDPSIQEGIFPDIIDNEFDLLELKSTIKNVQTNKEDDGYDNGAVTWSRHHNTVLLLSQFLVLSFLLKYMASN